MNRMASYLHCICCSTTISIRLGWICTFRLYPYSHKWTVTKFINMLILRSCYYKLVFSVLSLEMIMILCYDINARSLFWNYKWITYCCRLIWNILKYFKNLLSQELALTFQGGFRLDFPILHMVIVSYWTL